MDINTQIVKNYHNGMTGSYKEYKKALKAAEPIYWEDKSSLKYIVISGTHKVHKIKRYEVYENLITKNKLDLVDFFKIINLFMLKSPNCNTWGKKLNSIRNNLRYARDQKSIDKKINLYNQNYDEFMALYEVETILNQKIMSIGNGLILSNNKSIVFKVNKLDLKCLSLS